MHFTPIWTYIISIPRLKHTRGHEEEIQAASNHSILGNSFTFANPTCIALTGFDTRATAVNLEPFLIFKQVSNRRFPKFTQLLYCLTKEDIKALAGTINKKSRQLCAPSTILSDRSTRGGGPLGNECIAEKDHESEETD